MSSCLGPELAPGIRLAQVVVTADGEGGRAVMLMLPGAIFTAAVVGTDAIDYHH